MYDSKSAPIIGYVASYDEERCFLEGPADSIYKYGANLIFLSHSTNPSIIVSNIEVLDGLILGGGVEDISPRWQNENPIDNLGATDECRDVFELTLVKLCLEKDIPILGICRGCQMINLALGGDLYQDIFSQKSNALVDHIGSWRGLKYHKSNPNQHDILIKEDTKLFRIINSEKVIVNSYHHQSIRKLGKHLRISAYSSDGIIEAIESDKYRFVLGVQWHPEISDDSCSDALFGAFVDVIRSLR